MKPQFWPLLRFLALLALFRRLWALGFDYDRLPATITAFQPQTLAWFRDGQADSGTQEVEFDYIANDLTEGLAFITVDEAQRKGQVTFTVTIPGTFIMGLLARPLVDGTKGGVEFQRFDVAKIRAVRPTTSSDFSSTSAVDAPISHRSREKIIGGIVGGVGFLIVCIGLILFSRRKADRPPGRLLDRKGAQHLDRPVSDGRNVGDYRLTRGDANGPVDQANYLAIQAQMRLLMRRMERMETAEQGPPEYASAYLR
ncbi:hypothetical protein PQX77_010259 [Marasmius sp. AFHP31]|nr:hypothetical protein PQX77_010259 [Marasmius sp. AFHP31]